MAVQIAYRRADSQLNLLVDSTGIKFLSDGEWRARMHGVQGQRQWQKGHRFMDTATSDIRAVELTSSSDDGNPVLPSLLDQIPEDKDIGAVTADGACDSRRCHHGPSCYCDHPYPQERSTIERSFPGGNRPERNPTRHAALWKGVLEALDQIDLRSRIEAKMRFLKAFG